MSSNQPGVIEQTVYVRNINYDTEPQALGQAFGKFGPVLKVRIITTYDGRDQVSLGFGFVEFKTVEAYRAALDFKQPLVVDDRTLRIFPSRPPRQRKRDTAFILGIPKGTTPEDLKAAFADYNPTTARVVKEAEGAGKGFAFVTFATEEDQTRAVTEHRDGLNLKGGSSIVRYARPQSRRPRFGFRGPQRFAPRRAVRADRATDTAQAAPRRPGRGGQRGRRAPRGDAEKLPAEQPPG